MICKDCYGRGIIYQTNGYTGITIIKACHCNEPESPKKWLSDLIKNSARYNHKSEQEVKEYAGV